MKLLKELFAFPIYLKKVAEFDGVDFYGSDSLNEKVIEAMELSSVSKPISKELTELITNGIIVPVFSGEGMIKFLSRKISGRDFEYKHYYAFFNPPEGKIYILIDNNINILGYKNNNDLAKLIIHELIHRLSSLKPSYFLSKFKKELKIFYKEFYVKLFKLKDSKDLDFLIEEIYTSLFMGTEKQKEVDFKKLKIKFDRLRKYSELSQLEFNKVLFDYFKIIKLTINREFEVMYNGELNEILKVPYFVYKDKFGFFPTNKGCSQEFFAPSEVISSIAENSPTDVVYDSIKKVSK